MSIPTKAINKYTDCNHRIIFNGIFHRNRNIPNIRLRILNRTLNSQKDSDKETKENTKKQKLFHAHALEQ